MTTIQAIDLLKGLEQSLDDYCELNGEGKTAFRMAITALEVFGISEQLPAAQPDVPDTNVGDMISRQAAIDAIERNAYRHTYIDQIVDIIKELPSAQPEIIRCKDCKHWRDSDGVYRRGVNAESKCPLNTKEVYAGTFYCGDAERRTDEQTD